MAGLLCVGQDTRDEEAGQDEEQIDAAPADRGGTGEKTHGKIASRHPHREMKDQDEQDGQATNAVERRDVAGLRVSGGRATFVIEL